MIQVTADDIRVSEQLHDIDRLFSMCYETSAEIQRFIESSPYRHYLHKPHWLPNITAECERLAKAVNAFRSNHYDRHALRTKFTRPRTLFEITATYDPDPIPEMSDEAYRHLMIKEVDCLDEQLQNLIEYASDQQITVLSEFIDDLQFEDYLFHNE